MLTSPEAVAIQDTAEDPVPPPRFASRPIARHRSPQVPKVEVQCETHEYACYTSKEVTEFFNYIFKNQRSMCGNGIRVWDNGVRRDIIHSSGQM